MPKVFKVRKSHSMSACAALLPCLSHFTARNMLSIRVLHEGRLASAYVRHAVSNAGQGLSSHLSAQHLQQRYPGHPWLLSFRYRSHGE